MTDDTVFVEGEVFFSWFFSVNLKDSNGCSSTRERQTGGSGKEHHKIIDLTEQITICTPSSCALEFFLLARIVPRQFGEFNGADHNGSAHPQAVHLNSFSRRG